MRVELIQQDKIPSLDGQGYSQLPLQVRAPDGQQESFLVESSLQQPLAAHSTCGRHKNDHS